MNFDVSISTMRVDEYLRIYEAKHDDELLLLAGSSAELTDEARTALLSELGRRRLRAEAILDPAPIKIEQKLANPRSFPSQFGAVGEFLSAVMSTYRSHFWLFIWLIAPAIVFGYYGRELSRMFSRHLLQEFLAHAAGLTPDKLRFEAATVGGIINVVTWICFCVCYASTASAVSRIAPGDSPTVGTAFDEVLQRPGRFLGVSAVLGLLFVFATGLISFVYLWLMWFFRFDFRSSRAQFLPYGFGLLVTLALSRLALAIPAVTLGNCTVRQSIFRSDELTEGKWGLLAALLIKSIAGGYIAAMLPFWIAGWMWPYVHFYSWILTAASIMGVVLVEPILFIGFSLLYLDASQRSVQDGSRSVSVQLA